MASTRGRQRNDKLAPTETGTRRSKSRSGSNPAPNELCTKMIIIISNGTDFIRSINFFCIIYNIYNNISIIYCIL